MKKKMFRKISTKAGCTSMINRELVKLKRAMEALEHCFLPECKKK